MNSAQPCVNGTRRLFLALWPDDGVEQQLVAHASQWNWPSSCARCMAEDWHITLHFIGNVNADRVAGITANVGVPLQPFELVLDQPRLWPRGLAVLCASEVPAPLQSLHEQLGRALRGLDLAVETRPYLPHVTLARRAGATTAPATSAPVVWQARSYALVVSTGNRNQRYQIIRQYG